MISIEFLFLPLVLISRRKLRQTMLKVEHFYLSYIETKHQI